MSVNQLKAELNNTYVGAAAGAVIGYATSTGVIAGAVGGAAAAASFPLYCKALEYLNEDASETKRTFQATLLAGATGVAAPVLLTYAAGMVVAALLTASIPAAFIAYQAYKAYQNPHVKGCLNLVGRVTAWLPATSSEKAEQPKQAAYVAEPASPEDVTIPVRSVYLAQPMQKQPYEAPYQILDGYVFA